MKTELYHTVSIVVVHCGRAGVRGGNGCGRGCLLAMKVLSGSLSGYMVYDCYVTWSANKRMSIYGVDHYWLCCGCGLSNQSTGSYIKAEAMYLIPLWLS